MTQPRPWRATPAGVRVTLRVTARAARSRVQGLGALADGAPAVNIQVTAPPEDGKANTVALKCLATAWRLPPAGFALIQGHANRTKVVDIAGDAASLCAHLEAWLKHGS